MKWYYWLPIIGWVGYKKISQRFLVKEIHPVDAVLWCLVQCAATILSIFIGLMFLFF